MVDPATTRRQLEGEIAHWREAVDALCDLNVVAAPGAWAGLEQYLRLQVRDRLSTVVKAVSLEAAQLALAVSGGGLGTEEGRNRLLRLRSRYLQVETILDFYGDAVNTRANPDLAALLRGLDNVAGDSLDVILRPLGIESPPVIVYLDKGLGASILRAGVRLWDQANPSPAAAIKLTRHNLSHPTALFHETGHQVAHLTGWTAELADALGATLTRRSREVADLWRSWASEVAADVHAFALAGWAPLPALANVVDGSTQGVYRLLIGDPHPFPMVRVLFNAALCRSWYGAGPWDDVARTWLDRHPPDRARSDGTAVTRVSIDAFADIVDACTRRPMAAFRGRPLHELADPRHASPAALARLNLQAGPSLVTSAYLARRESLRILAMLSTRSLDDPANAVAHARTLRSWLIGLGGVAGADPIPDPRRSAAA